MMASFLLFIIYIAFIGLGLPDSMFGTAWPAIYADFALPISYGSFITSIVACGTIVSTLFSARLIHKFGTNKVVAVSTLLTAVALLGFSFSNNIWVMMLLSVPLGLGAGAVDVALNNYVALHYSAKQMSFLHCFYGIGVSVSPYVLSLVIGGENGWRNGYQIAFFIQIAISILLFASQSVWNKVGKTESSTEVDEVKNLTIRETLKIPGVKSMCALFFLTCVIECRFSCWGITYLVEYKHMSAEQAASVILFYFVGMALGRFLSGVFADKVHSWKIIMIGELVLGVAVFLLALPGSAMLSSIGLFMIGLGNGPLFPNFNHLAPESFGKDVSESVISLQMAAAYVGVLVGPLLCGLLGQGLGMFIFPIYIICAFIAMAVITVSAQKLLKKKE
ncbi:MAG: MFS transporter [Clostridia bacterium]|nr:MFS transporter [Clostridia bacterium]